MSEFSAGDYKRVYDEMAGLQTGVAFSGWAAAKTALEVAERVMTEADGGFVLMPRTAPDAAFDAAWALLGEDRFSGITQKISVHDARVFFRATWSAMVGACNEGARKRVLALERLAEEINEAHRYPSNADRSGWEKPR